MLGSRVRVIAAPFPIPSLANCAWKGAPYSAGVKTRWARLAPKTAVPHSAASASTLPSSAVPTGTGSRPRPRSSAYLMPMTAAGGAPPLAAALTTAAGSGRGAGSRPSSWALRTAGQADSATTLARVARVPITATSGSTATAPGSLIASLASPTGVSGESDAARPTAPAAPTAPMTAARARPSATNCLVRRPSAARGWRSSASTTNCRAAACPITASPASAASQASAHQPAACGLIPRCTAPASAPRSSVPSGCSGRSRLSNPGRSAAPRLSRT